MDTLTDRERQIMDDHASHSEIHPECLQCYLDHYDHEICEKKSKEIKDLIHSLIKSNYESDPF